MNEIEKIKYSISRFDVERMVMGKRDVPEIFPDGRVTFRCYQTGSRKCIKKDETKSLPKDDFRLLCAKLLDYISTADRANRYIDDTGGELKIYHSFGRVDTMPHGYGNEQRDVGMIVREYLSHASCMDVYHFLILPHNKKKSNRAL